MWGSRWGYGESVAVVLGLLLVGTLWEWLLPPLSLGALGGGWSIVVVSAVVLLSVWLGWRTRRGARAGEGGRRYNRLEGFLVSPQLSLVVLGAFLCGLLVLGLLPQGHVPSSSSPSLLQRLGWHHVLESYPFYLVYLLLLLVLGGVTFRWAFSRSKLTLRWFGFVSNHLGLWLFLLFGLLSSSDLERYRMVLPKGEVEWRGQGYSAAELKELPLAFELRDFRMEEYPPRLMLLDKDSGTFLPKGASQHLVMDSLCGGGQLCGYRVEVVERLRNSSPIRAGEQVRYVGYGTEGNVPSFRVRVQDAHGKETEGWVGAQSHLFPPHGLQLSDSTMLVLVNGGPRQYYSDVKYYTKWGAQGTATLSVNAPLRLGSWYAYQQSYDESRGRWSSYSVVEVVNDSWYWGIVVSGVLLLGGALLLMLVPMGGRA